MAEDIAGRITASQNLLLHLVESEADRRPAEAPPNRWKRQRAERRYDSFPHAFTKLELTVEAPCGLTLELETNLPEGNSTSGAQCRVGVFRLERHENSRKLQDHLFVPAATGQGPVSWQRRDGTTYTPQQLCDFAFEQLREHAERCCPSARPGELTAAQGVRLDGAGVGPAPQGRPGGGVHHPAAAARDDDDAVFDRRTAADGDKDAPTAPPLLAGRPEKEKR